VLTTSDAWSDPRACQALAGDPGPRRLPWCSITVLVRVAPSGFPSSRYVLRRCAAGSFCERAEAARPGPPFGAWTGGSFANVPSNSGAAGWSGARGPRALAERPPIHDAIGVTSPVVTAPPRRSARGPRESEPHRYTPALSCRAGRFDAPTRSFV